MTCLFSISFRLFGNRKGFSLKSTKDSMEFRSKCHQARNASRTLLETKGVMSIRFFKTRRNGSNGEIIKKEF